MKRLNWIFVTLAVSSLLTLGGTAPAVGAPTSTYRHRVDPKVEVWLASPVLRARTLGVEAATVARAPVTVRFVRLPARSTLRRLRQGGVRFVQADTGDGLMHLGVIYPANVGRAGLKSLARSPEVEQVELDLVLTRTRPLDVTAKDVQATTVWPQQEGGVALTGEGMLIGNIDAGADVFHPAFFRADGKLYNWLDTDGDGLFKPGTDAVDLDGDGTAGAGETLGLLEGVVYDVYRGIPILNSKDGKYDPKQDWLFADTDGDGQRDQGATAGFKDTDPTFGEPLFVGEDLDGDGALDPEEKVRALKTNKVKAVRTGGTLYTRGKDLSLSVAANKSNWLYHGTATTGTLVGGQRGYLSRVGLAPDAEVLIGTDQASGSAADSLSQSIIWMAKTPVHVMLHEYSDWSGQHLDGSSNTESLLDQATQLGIPQVVPAGNLGGSGKSMRVTIKSGETRAVPVKFPGSGSGSYPNYAMQLTLLWRTTAVSLQISLTDPAGTKVVVSDSNTTGKTLGTTNITYYNYRYDSSRNTAMVYAMLMGGTSSSPEKITPGTWTLTFEHPGTGGAVDVLGYASDATGGWTSGISFGSDTTEKNLVVWPATADSAITVCAYAGHVGSPYEYQPTGDKSGDLRKYSGRGQRVDGKAILDVCAPDNPIVPTDASAGVTTAGGHRVFGGTSGAGPHVAAAALLLRQYKPTLGASAVESALQKSAQADIQTGTVPSDTWGHGKLRIHRAIYGKDPSPNEAPTAAITCSETVKVGTSVTFTADVKDTEDSTDKLKIRWDKEYDGTWDTPLAAPLGLTQTFTAVGKYRVKLMVQDSGGLIGEAAALITVVSATSDLGGAGDAGATDLGDAGDGDDDDGCGCRLTDEQGPLGLTALLLLLVALRRRRDL